MTMNLMKWGCGTALMALMALIANGCGEPPTTLGSGGAAANGSSHTSGNGGAGAGSLVDGSACNDNDVCQSGYCVDGVCCESACDGACMACDEPGVAGVCAAAQAGSLEAACGDGVCDGAGECAAGAVTWSRGFADENASVAVAGNAFGVVTDSSGNVYIAGFYRGNMKFAGISLSSINGTNDIFVAKLTAAGDVVWAKSFGGPGDDRGEAIAIHPSGGVLVACVVHDGADLGAGAPYHTAAATEVDSDGVVLRLSDTGGYVWHTAVAGPNTDRATSVAVSPSGAIVVAGDNNGVADIAGTPLPLSVGPQGFVARLSTTGQPLWVRSVFESSPGYRSIARSVTISNDGTLYLTGFYSPNADNINAYFGSFALADGSPHWEKHFGDTTFDKGQAVAAAPSGGFWATGFFTKRMDFGGDNLPACKMVSAGFDDSTPATTLETKVYRDIFIVKFDATGTARFCASFGSYNPTAGADQGFLPHHDTGHGVAVDSSGNVIVTGSFSNTVDFGSGSHVSAGGTDAFILKLSADGTHLWDVTCGSVGAEQSHAVTVDANDNVLPSGDYAGANGCSAGQWPLPNNGNAPFVMKMSR